MYNAYSLNKINRWKTESASQNIFKTDVWFMVFKRRAILIRIKYLSFKVRKTSFASK